MLIAKSRIGPEREYKIRTLDDLAFWVNFCSYEHWTATPRGLPGDTRYLVLIPFHKGVKTITLDDLDPVQLSHVFSFWTFQGVQHGQ